MIQPPGTHQPLQEFHLKTNNIPHMSYWPFYNCSPFHHGDVTAHTSDGFEYRFCQARKYFLRQSVMHFKIDHHIARSITNQFLIIIDHQKASMSYQY